MKTWTLKFASYKTPDDIFDLVVSGKKTIETRQRNTEGRVDYSIIKAGDTVFLKSLTSGRIVERKVVFVHLYDSVSEMVNKENEDKILPGIGSKKNLIKFYDEAKKKWGKSYAEKLERYGIVAIGME